MSAPAELLKLTRRDFASDQTVRWCPGCGDYAVLAQIQKTLPELGVPREEMVFISGIGCSSRFPYDMNTYGFHSSHGRGPTSATGRKRAIPTPSSTAGTSERKSDIGGASSLRIKLIRREKLSVRKGCRPVNNSYITTPSEKRSDRLLILSSRNCSGDM